MFKQWLSMLFGCQHERITWAHKVDSQMARQEGLEEGTSYIRCLDCGKAIPSKVQFTGRMEEKGNGILREADVL
jgi:hypothetical protein